MGNWYYYDKHVQKKGPYNFGQLRWLAREGVVTPQTIVEPENGKSQPANNVKGLVFAEAIRLDAETYKRRCLYVSVLGLIFFLLMLTGAWRLILLGWLVWGVIIAIVLLPLMLTDSSRRAVADIFDSIMSDR